MKKALLFIICIFYLVSSIYGQSTSVTNNTTITIQGNVYYFRPSTTPSSPQPTITGPDFIGTGSWYGEDAARAWASIADWAIERCLEVTPPVTGRSGERVFISSVHAYRANTADSKRYSTGGGRYATAERDYTWQHFNGITIYYWIVPANVSMENGRREARSFKF